MKKGILILGVLLIITGLVLNFTVYKDQDLDNKEEKQEEKKDEKLTPAEPAEQTDDETTDEEQKEDSGKDDTDDYFAYSFQEYNRQLLTPGTYTIKNLEEEVISNYIDLPEQKKFKNCGDNYANDAAYYVTEEEMKNAFEATFGKGTYKRFTYRTYGGCDDMTYNAKTKRYESACIMGCGDERSYEYDTSIISKTKSGDNTIYVEKVVQTSIETEKVVGTYELTYTIRTADNVFISVTSKKL